MKCPVCKEIDLNMTERQGIEIDYCPNCRGVWLDRGELDKIVERSLAGEAARVMPSQASPSPAPYCEDRHRGDHDDHHGYGHGRKRKSWLGDLFD